MPDSEQYDVLEKIGHGSFGVIRKVRRRTDGMVLCRKEISYLKMSQKEREQLHAEFQILSTLSHPNIVGYYHREHLKASQDLHLYMEYCGNGDLGRVIRNLTDKNQYAEEAFVWSIFSQLVTALYRCHYGVDPPEVGKTVLGLGTTAKPKAPTGGMTILHRDLKPENVFLGEDNSVKLGDFGLSKVMESHDFASTYVGTPFYMSPEICAAEKYTLKSDIWSLGCIIYELCSREPPFNAKSHFQLVQKIKEGKISALPGVYSTELMAVIKDCLRVNPDRRPDTAALLNLPVVRLMRKEKEVVDFGKALKSKEETLEKRLRKAQDDLERSKLIMRAEIDNQLRREWEVKARLEIDRHVQREIEELQKKFEHEVQSRVKAELEIQKKTVTFTEKNQEFSSSNPKSDFPSSYPSSSIGAVSSADGEFPSSSDITDLSDDAPEPPPEATKKTARTPFGRAQTMFAVPSAATPMDIEMASPSPIAIASLSLSPRRNGATKAPSAHTNNIFTANNVAQTGSQWDEVRDSSMEMNSDSEDDAPIPSPTRNVRSNKNPFTSKQRPNLQAQKTTGNIHFISKQTGLPIMMNPKPSNSELHATAQAQAGQTGLRRTPSNRTLQERSGSPNRRLSKIPSAANLVPALHHNSSGSDGGPTPGTRKSSLTKSNEGTQPQQQQAQQQPPALSKAVNKGNNIRGRTLVELQQARAGGRPLSAVDPGTNVNLSPKRAFREHAAAGNRGTASEPAAVWDPERDEMPSPFLVRRKPMAKPLRGDVPVLSFQ